MRNRWWMEHGYRSYQDAICGAIVTAMCYLKQRQHQQQQQQQQLQHELQERNLLRSQQQLEQRQQHQHFELQHGKSQQQRLLREDRSESTAATTATSSLFDRTPSTDQSYSCSYGYSSSLSGSLTSCSAATTSRSRPIVQAEPLSTDWTQLEVIELINDGTGLGFGIIGGRSTGVVVKTILPGGIADQDTHLRSGDHILQIGDVNVRGMSSEQVALVLRQSGSHVRLVVARPVNELPPFQIPHAPVIPTDQLDEHMAHFNAFIAMEQADPDQHLRHLHLQQLQQQQQQQHQKTLYGSVQVHPQPVELTPEMAEVDWFEVDLVKDSHGLGITIAGYVGGDNTPDEISGIFVKSITDGSAAAVDGRIQVNDQIIEVDGRSLQGFSNHEAVEVLKNTNQTVKLKLVRFRHGPKYDKLQEYFGNQGLGQASPKESTAVSNPVYDLDSKQVDNDYSGDLSPEVELATKAAWEPIVGSDFLVVVAQLAKFKEGGGLGISLEGTVDVEGGVEMRPHHYIRSILPDGPVGLNGRLKSSDELLEVNGRRLLGLNHVNVVDILKDLPQHVRLVCARRKSPLPDTFQPPEIPITAHVTNSVLESPHPPVSERLVKAKSEMALSTVEPSLPGSLSKSRSRSLEPLTGLAMWSPEPVVIELEKGSRGLGFSILDYQDPVNPTKTVIVIRSLVPGGIAQMDGQLVPGDRLVFVNDANLEHATLDEAVQALKGAQRGMVRIGVAKPLPLTSAYDNLRQNPELTTSFEGSGIAGAQINGHEDPLFPTTPPESQLAEVQVQQNFSVPPLELDTSGAALDTSDLKGLDTDQVGLSLEHSFTHSEGSSSGADRSRFLDRKDSFYESDDERKTPLKCPRLGMVKVESDVEETPPAYEHAITPAQIETGMMAASPFSVTANFTSAPTGPPPPPLPPTHPPSETVRNPKFENLIGGEQGAFAGAASLALSTSDTVPAVSSSSTANNTTIPSPSSSSSSSSSSITADFHHHQQTAPSPVTVVVKSSALPLPSYNEALESSTAELDASLDASEGGGGSPGPSPDLSGTPTSAAPLAQLDSTESDSDQLNSRAGLSSRLPSSTPVADHVTPSDLMTPPGSPRIRSPDTLSMGSPDLGRFPTSLERTIHVHKGNQRIGLTVDASDRAVNGCQVTGLAKASAAEQDGRVHPGDYVTAVNNESMRKITNAQARAILRRASLQGAEISITYIPAAATKGIEPAAHPDYSQSPTLQKLSQSLSQPEQASPILARAAPPEGDSSSPTPSSSSPAPPSGEVKVTSPGQKTLLTDGSPAVGNQGWGPPRPVELAREPGKSLGISIVGGRVDMFNVSQEHSNSGIFIKHVLGDSPAGRNGTLKKGDRILEVNGSDVRNATHDEAVDVIRNSSSPITFLVESLTTSTCPGDLETAQLKPAQPSSSEEPSVVPAPAIATPAIATQISVTSSSPGSTPQHSFEMKDDSEDEDEFGYTKKRVARKYSELPGMVQLVDLHRGKAGMGLGLAGNKDRSKMSVFVAGIQPDSPAERDGRIQVGDELLEVNSINLQGLSHLNASATIKGVTLPVVKLVTHRRQDSLDHMAVKPLRYGGSSQFDTHSAPAVEVVATSPKSAKRDAAPPLPAVQAPAISATAAAPTASAPPPPPPTPQQQPTAATAAALGSTDTIQIIKLDKPEGQSAGVRLEEDNKGGRQGIYVSSIVPGSVAAEDQQLAVGDEILEVGDKSLTGVSQTKATEMLDSSPTPLRLKVRKCAQPNASAAALSATTALPQEKLTLNNTTDESTTDPVELEDEIDPKTCPIQLGKQTYIEIEKGKTGLGLSIVGGSDTLLGAIIIHEVYEDGAAARDGRLWAGDQILEVNNEDLADSTHTKALRILRQTPPVVKMAVYRDESQVREEDILDVFSVDLIKRPGKGLGLSIVGKKSDVGIYISDIVKGGVAEADARLMQGDQILAVNGEDMRSATQEYAAAVLKTLMGKVSLTVGRLKAGSKASSRKNSSHGTSLKKSDSSVSNKSKGKHSRSIPSSKSY